MFRRIMTVLILSFFLAQNTYAIETYGNTYCSDPRYKCHTVWGGQTWQSMFRDPTARDIVMRVNRTNMQMYPGLVIAVPRDLDKLTLYDVAPFPRKIPATGNKVIIVELSRLAWGAYNAKGSLVFWGPISSARGWCEEDGECHTPTGKFQVQRKGNFACMSSEFPKPNGGAAMPFCMFFNGPYALHGSFEVPGYNASHGCVRMFINDARWLNEHFANMSTKVIVRQ